jgi:enolase
MKIAKMIAREIFDSRGLPTIECGVVLDDGMVVTASVPSGISRSRFEAAELRDGGHRLFGLGVTRAIEYIERDISQILVGIEPNVVEADARLIELDGTDDKSRLGANTLLAASIAVCRAQAYLHDMELYELIAHLLHVEHVSLPFPMLNVVNGGLHADTTLPIQEFMVVPLGAHHFRDAMEAGVNIYQILKQLFRQQGLSTNVGDEGGFAPSGVDERAVLDCIVEACALCGIERGKVGIALDVAASGLYDPESKMYTWGQKQYTADALIEYYQQLIQQYPIYSIEDGLSEVDWQGWQKMTQQLGSEVQLVGDDIFATHPQRIIDGLKDTVANAAVIKPNQVGTVTETLQAIRLCQENNMNIIVSHRSGETNDTFIVDLAVGSSSGQIKAGGCARGECMEKYNRLLAIEDTLALSLLD